jgi:peptidyl-prolyl cis-trans isomerase D
VGSTKIGTAQLAKQAQQAVEVARQQTPGLTMKALLAAGGLQQVLDQMIDEEAQVAFGREHGVIAGKRLIDSELAKIPAFQGAGGKFDENTYRSVLAQRQLNDADVRDSFARELVARQLLAPVKLGAVMPKGPVLQYAALLREQRNGASAFCPPPPLPPRASRPRRIAAWYATHKAAYTSPSAG